MALDFTNMFAVDPNTVNLPAKQPGGLMNTVGNFMTNPAVQIAALNAAEALDPTGVGGQMAKMTKLAVQGQQAAGQLGKATSAPTSAPASAATNPLDAASTLTTAGSLLKKGYELDPSLLPSGYSDLIRKAVDAQPFTADTSLQNPMEPIGDTLAGQSPVGVQPPVQPFNFTMDPGAAMAMGPELVKDVYKMGADQVGQQLNIQEQVNRNLLAPAQAANLMADARHKNWVIQPERVEEQIKINTAPVLAQFDVYRQKNELTKANIDAVLKANPGLAEMKLPGGGTVAQWAAINAADPDGAKNISSIIAQGIHYNALKYSADVHYQGVLATAKAAGEDREFYKGVGILEKYSKDIAILESLPTPEDYTKAGSNALFKYPKGARTPDVGKTIENMKKERDALGAKIYGPSYQKIIEMEKSAGLTGETVVTPEDLKNFKGTETGRAGSTAPIIPSSPSKQIQDMFSNPYMGDYNGMM